MQRKNGVSRFLITLLFRDRYGILISTRPTFRDGPTGRVPAPCAKRPSINKVQAISKGALMSKERNTRKDIKKAPAKTMKEKREAKKAKKAAR